MIAKLFQFLFGAKPVSRPQPDPVRHDAKGWWFWEENWAHRQGPFETELAARWAFQVYVKYDLEAL